MVPQGPVISEVKIPKRLQHIGPYRFVIPFNEGFWVGFAKVNFQVDDPAVLKLEKKGYNRVKQGFFRFFDVDRSRVF